MIRFVYQNKLKNKILNLYLSGTSNTGVPDTKKAGFCVRLVKD
jgi:hypothetical protein